MTKKTRTVLVIVLLLACMTTTAIFLGKRLAGWGEQSDDDPWRKK